jgi:hypothetical protein
VPEVAAVSPASHNDVFFQRRVDETTFEDNPRPHEVVHLGEVSTPMEIPEIAEVTDIVRIAEVTQSEQNSQLPQTTILPEPRALVVVPTPPPTITAVEEPIAAIEATPPMVKEVPVAVVEPMPPAREEEKEPVKVIPPAAPKPAVQSASHSQPEPQKSGGFFKRLFGRRK